MRIGYAKYSPSGDSIDRQRAELKIAGCTTIIETESGDVDSFSGLERAMAEVTTSDVLVVTSLNCLGACVADVAQIADRLARVGANLVSLRDGLDSSGPQGAGVINAIRAMAKLESTFHGAAVRAGMRAAKRNGKVFGRQPRINPDTLQAARQMIENDGQTVSSAARALGLPVSTLWKSLKRADRANNPCKGVGVDQGEAQPPSDT